MENNNSKMDFEELVQLYSLDLRRYAHWLCSDYGRAEDVVQETLLRAWRSIDSLRDKSGIKSWLITILRRENARQYQRYTPTFIDDFDFDSIAGDDVGDREDTTETVRDALKKVDKKYAEPLVLQVVFGHSCAEIGEILNLSTGAVATRVHRARLQMMELISAEKATNQPLEDYSDFAQPLAA